MKRRTVQRRPRQWTLDRLYRECRAAAVVWLALSEIANEAGSNHVTPTRELLSKRTGIRRLPTVSAALTALSQGRWAKIEHVPVTENHRQVGTVLKITLLHRRNEKRYIGQKPIDRLQTRHRAHEKRSIAIERKSFQESPTETSASRVGLGTPTGTRGAALEQKAKTDCDGGGPTRPITEILGLKNG